ncbi:MAG: EF-P lysine aminoacylase EpmA [Nevskiales bacterium]
MADNHWRPSADQQALRLRADWLTRIRSFFAARGVLEVETPLLSAASNTDPNLASITAQTAFGPRWLHTSPEFAMKRLLAGGSGPIYQICKVFRDGEQGRWHNPEFTMLEWYRPGFDEFALMDEVETLLRELLQAPAAEFLTESVTYVDAVRQIAGVDALASTPNELQACLQRHQVPLPETGPSDAASRDFWLDLIMGEVVGPKLGLSQPCFVYDYPASQAALARLKPGGVAARFELYWKGVELANGFHELTDAAEQRSRLARDRAQRRSRGLPMVPQDEHLLEALAQGLPDCSGVALGLDRLLALALGYDSLQPVLSFPFDRA